MRINYTLKAEDMAKVDVRSMLADGIETTPEHILLALCPGERCLINDLPWAGSTMLGYAARLRERTWQGTPRFYLEIAIGRGWLVRER